VKRRLEKLVSIYLNGTCAGEVDGSSTDEAEALEDDDAGGWKEEEHDKGDTTQDEDAVRGGITGCFN
jgi:hypothetical protein